MSQKETLYLVRLLTALLVATAKKIEDYLRSSLSNAQTLIQMAVGGEYAAPVTIIIAGIMWVICIPIYVNEVQNTNTSTWSFTGSTGAVTLFLFMPFAFIAGGLVWIVKKVLK